MNKHANTASFWRWFTASSDLLLHQPPHQVVDLVVDRLRSIDFQLSAEIGLAADRSRELTITSHGNSICFEFIYDFVNQAPDLPHWKFTALKNPRGFNFSRDGFDLALRSWTFIPLKRNQQFSELGLFIEMPPHDFEQVDEFTVASILEEGVGEVLFSVCSHLGFGVSQTPDALPIEELTEMIRAWCEVRGPAEIRRFLPPTMQNT